MITLRLTETGKLDSTFGGGSGRAPLPASGPASASGFSRALDVATTRDGRLIVAGFTSATPPVTTFALLGYR
jgi:hypothetical protein